MGTDRVPQFHIKLFLLFVAGLCIPWILVLTRHLSVLVTLASCALVSAFFAWRFFATGLRGLSMFAFQILLLSGGILGLEGVARILHKEWVRDSWSAPLIEKDSEIGTILIPDVSVSHQRYPQTLQFQLEWDVTYHTESDRSRRVPDRPTRGKRFAIFGDSIMFGEGLEDESTIPNHLQRLLPAFRVFNYAVSGHGTSQNYLYLKRVLQEHPDTAACMVGFMTDHIRRTTLTPELMASWAREHPLVRQEEGVIVSLGRGYDTLGWASRRHVDLLAESTLYSRLRGRPWSPSPSDWKLVADVILAMRDACEGDGSRSFFFVVLPSGIEERNALAFSKEYAELESKIRGHGVSVINLYNRFEAAVRSSHYPRESFFFQDSHPNLRFVELATPWIAEEVEKRFQQTSFSAR